MAGRLTSEVKDNCDVVAPLNVAIRSGCLNSDSLERVDWFGQLPQSLPCVLYECSSDLTVTRISSNSAELIGISPESLIGSRALFEERLYGGDCPGLIANLERVMPGAIVCENHRIVDDQGLHVWICHSLRKALNSTSGSIIRGSLIPIGRETFGRHLNVAVVSEFVHKMGNHFQLINLLIGSLKRAGMGSSEIDMLQRAVDRTVEFTRSFSNYSQAPSSRSELDLGEVVNDAVKSCFQSSVEKKVALNWTMDGSLARAVVHGDPFFLDLAFGAIVQNALEATQPGDSVNIKAKIHDSGLVGRATAEIVVEDTGSGMDRDTLAQAVVPFFSSRRDRDGLGLSLAVRIIELHDGVLTISSKELGGTQVAVILPVSVP